MNLQIPKTMIAKTTYFKQDARFATPKGTVNTSGGSADHLATRTSDETSNFEPARAHEFTDSDEYRRRGLRNAAGAPSEPYSDAFNFQVRWVA